MKNQSRLLLAICALFCALACTEKANTETADIIALSRDEVAFPQAGGSVSIGIGCPGDWEATTTATDWLSLTSGNGVLTIAASLNNGVDVRKAEVTVSSSAKTVTVSVIQTGAAAPRILVNAPESVEFDSEKDSIIFSVDGKAGWSASADASWLSVVKEDATGLVTVKCAPNEGERRQATVSITAGGKASTIAVSQISRAENPYFNFVGSYALWAEDWYVGGAAIGASGIGTKCTVEADEYGKSFIIKDLFHNGTVNHATYDKAEKTMVITTGAACKEEEEADGNFTLFYLVEADFDSKQMFTENLTCRIEPGYNEETDPEHTTPVKTLSISGLDGNALGLVGYFSKERAYGYFSDLYYAAGNMYFVEITE